MSDTFKRSVGKLRCVAYVLRNACLDVREKLPREKVRERGILRANLRLRFFIFLSSRWTSSPFARSQNFAKTLIDYDVKYTINKSSFPQILIAKGTRKRYTPYTSISRNIYNLFIRNSLIFPLVILFEDISSEFF